MVPEVYEGMGTQFMLAPAAKITKDQLRVIAADPPFQPVTPQPRLIDPAPPKRDLREVIPSGKGRVSADEYLSRIRRGQTCGIQSLLFLVDSELSQDIERPSILCVVGGGPTLADEAPALRRLVKKGAKIIAVNKSHDWLKKRGFPVHYSVLLDPKEWVAGYVDLTLDKQKIIRKRAGNKWVETKHLIASQCHDDVLAKFKGNKNAYLWHAGAGLGESDILKEEFKKEPWVNIAGASVVGLRAVPIGIGLGFREFHTFGIDGSAKGPTDDEVQFIYNELVKTKTITVDGGIQIRPRAEIMEIIFLLSAQKRKLPPKVNDTLRKYMYAYDKPETEHTWRPFTVDLKAGWSRSFFANHHMARSVYEFDDSMDEWDKQIKDGRLAPFRIRVHGNPEQSAIAMIAAGMGIHAMQEHNDRYGNEPT